MDGSNSTPIRVCTTCKISKPAIPEFFHAYKRSPDGRRSVCKDCRAADNAANREARTAAKRKHYHANKERLSAAVRSYYAANAEALRTSALERHYKNRNKRLAQMQDYRRANADTLNQRRRPKGRAEFKARYGVDLAFTLKHRVRSLIRATLVHGRQGRRMTELLGYTVDELRRHLERQFSKGMSWERFMSGEIHIDHILPVASFGAVDANSPEFRACWALSNLRPAWAVDNLSKSAKILTLL